MFKSELLSYNDAMSRLSVVLATFNEEENLPPCLDSISQIADEIVVVDGRSTDKTVEIAKQYRAKITITDNPPIFHINKQKAIDKATGDWILQLDADEVVSLELRKEIESQITNHKSRDVNGYWIPRKNWFLGRFLMKGGQYPDYTLRLYRRGKGGLPQKSVHEQAVVEGEAGYLAHPLLHYPYKNFSIYVDKWNRYVDLLAVEIRDEFRNRNLAGKIFCGIGYLLLKPLLWFLTSYVRHKGFMDSWQGFVFAFYSSFRFPIAFVRSFSH